MLNGSFEIILNCNGGDIQGADGWFSPNEGTPDLFNECVPNSLNYSVPANAFGFQNAHTGQGYAGIVTYSFGLPSTPSYREYVQSKLKTSLIEGQLYVVGLWVNLSSRSPFATNNMGIGFCEDNIQYSNSEVLVPTQFLHEKAVIDDTSNWVMLSWIYTAIGNENYVIIGNFFNDTGTNVTQLNPNDPGDPYYYIDDIFVVPLNLGNVNVFTPNGDGINDVAFQNPILTNYEISILNRWGNSIKVTTFDSGWDGTDVSGKQLIEGTYYYTIKNLVSGNIEKTGFIQLIR